MLALNQIHTGHALYLAQRLADNSIHLGIAKITQMCYNTPCRSEQVAGRFVFQNAVTLTQYFIVGKAPLISGLTSRCSLRQRRQANKGLFVMRNEKGQFVKGHRSSRETEFKKGQHWREKKPYWDRDWLYNEYVVKQRSSSEIASDFNVKDAAILFFLKKHGIARRNTSEVRAVKHWGASGESNPMFGKRKEDNPNWKGGLTPERQAFYSSIEWRSLVPKVWERDNGKCQKCGKQDNGKKSLHIHHITPFKIVETRADINNLVLLCSKCHGWVHSKKNVNKEFIR